MKAPSYRPKLDLTDWQNVNKHEYAEILSNIAPDLHSYVEEHAALSHLMDKVREGYNAQIYQQALQEIGEELQQHFAYEEQFILPRLSRRFAAQEAGPAAKLRQEHGVIRKNFEEVSALFAQHNPAEPDKDLIQKMNLLAYLLKKHIEKEDHYFFPLVSLILTPEEKRQIAAEVAEAYRKRQEKSSSR